MAQRLKVETRRLEYPRDLCDPKDWLNFVQLDPFCRACKRLELLDDDIRAIEISIMLDPEQSPVIPGTGGLRKLRFSAENSNQGKRGAFRVCYVYFKEHGLVTLVLVYGKSQKDNLSASDKKLIKALIGEIEEYLSGRRLKRNPAERSPA